MKIFKSIVVVTLIIGFIGACKNLEKIEDTFSGAGDNQTFINEVSETLNLTLETDPLENLEGSTSVEEALTAEEITEDKATISLRKIIIEVRGYLAEDIAECAGVVSARYHRAEMRAQVDALGETPTEEAKAALASELKEKREAFRQTREWQKKLVKAYRKSFLLRKSLAEKIR